MPFKIAFILPIFLLLFAFKSYTQPKTIKVACIGNSITWGSGIDNRAQDCYPNQLQKMLGAGHEVHNFGVGGSTLLKLGDKPYWKEGSFKEALAFQPDIVIIKLGTNDTKPQNWDRYGKYYKEDYQSLIKEFRNLPSKPTVYLCTPVPVYGDNFGIRASVMDQEVLPLVKVIAKEMNAPLIDLYTALSGKPEHFPDLIHPNAAGARIIAETVHKALKK